MNERFNSRACPSSADSAISSTVVAFDDPVPSDTVILEDTVRTSSGSSPHVIERQVQQMLASQPDLCFSSLVVRRLRDGVCIEGILESGSDTEVCLLARQVAGVNEVVNHLLVRHPRSPRPH